MSSNLVADEDSKEEQHNDSTTIGASHEANLITFGASDEANLITVGAYDEDNFIEYSWAF